MTDAAVSESDHDSAVDPDLGVDHPGPEHMGFQSDDVDVVTDRSEAEDAPPVRRVLPLAGGALAAAGFGIVVAGWVAWLLSRSPAPWRGGWTRWLLAVPGSGWFTAAATGAVAVAVVVSIWIVTLITYRRQSAIDRAHDLNVEVHHTAQTAQQTAAQSARLAEYQLQVSMDRLALDSRALRLGRRVHRLDQQRRSDERERDLRGRFLAASEQLGSPLEPVRLAGAYSLAALADDWKRAGFDSELQVCVSLICGILRSDSASGDQHGGGVLRKALAQLIRQHRRRVGAHAHEDGVIGWHSCQLDLSGAHLADLSFVETDLRDVLLWRSDLTKAVMVNCDLRNAALSGAQLSGVNLTDADLSGADLRQASIAGAWMAGANLARADLTKANFSGTVLGRAVFTGATLVGVDFSGADLSDAVLDKSVHDATTKWPVGFHPAPSGGPHDGQRRRASSTG